MNSLQRKPQPWNDTPVRPKQQKRDMMDWIKLAQDRGRCQELVNVVMNLQVQ